MRGVFITNKSTMGRDSRFGLWGHKSAVDIVRLIAKSARDCIGQSWKLGGSNGSRDIAIIVSSSSHCN